MLNENTSGVDFELFESLKEKCRSSWEFYEGYCRYAVQLAHFLDGELVDKLLERSGCPSADELEVSSISEVRKAISRKPIYSDIFNEEQRTSVEQHWDKMKEELGWNDKLHYQGLKRLKKLGLPSKYDPEFSVADAPSKLSKDPEIASITKELLEVYKKIRT